MRSAKQGSKSICCRSEWAWSVRSNCCRMQRARNCNEVRRRGLWLCANRSFHVLFSINESKNVMKAIGTTRASVRNIQQNTLVQLWSVNLYCLTEVFWKITEKKFSSMSKACSVMTKSVFQKFIACVVYLCVFLWSCALIRIKPNTWQLAYQICRCEPVVIIRENRKFNVVLCYW